MSVLDRAAARFAPVGLAELEARAALQNRLDTKYLVDDAVLAGLCARLRATHAALEIDGLRVFAYESVYFDSADLATYRAHLQGRRRRFKCRSRRYVDSGLTFFELKLRGPRGRTVKRRIAHTEPWTVTPEACAFVAGVLRDAYGHGLTQALGPTLRTRYRRLTLVSRDGAERVTMDVDLAFEAGAAAARLRPGHALVESKAAGRRALADRVLLELGARPFSGSKYCLGVGLTHPVRAANATRRLVRRAFEPLPAVEAAA